MMEMIPVGQKQQSVTNIAKVMWSGGGGWFIVTGPGATWRKKIQTIATERDKYCQDVIFHNDCI